jgi:Sporulation and spore germination/Immunoglobulin-like domain of bacterial spore germination
MTRRAVAGLARLLPILLIAAATTIVVAAALLAACGGSSGGSSPQPTATVTVTAEPSETPTGQSSPSPSAAPAPTTVRPYFLRGEKLGVAERRVKHTTMPATATMKVLLAGPSASERAAGLGTTIPGGTRLLALSIDGGTARVDLSGEFASGGGSLSMTARVAQVVYTLTRFPTVRAVQFFMDGEPLEALGGEGIVLDGPQRRADWRDFEPPIFVESPGVGGVVASPFTLAGTASVFEGSFMARLVDSSGRRIVSTSVQASQGAPGRGRFAREIAFSSSAARGTLIVYDQSMEDGSRQDEVRIPVTFATD